MGCYLCNILQSIRVIIHFDAQIVPNLAVSFKHAPLLSTSLLSGTMKCPQAHLVFSLPQTGSPLVKKNLDFKYTQRYQGLSMNSF